MSVSIVAKAEHACQVLHCHNNHESFSGTIEKELLLIILKKSKREVICQHEDA